MPHQLLIATDLDRTLLPNGPLPESDGARERFARLAGRPEVALAFVTGRDLTLVEEAIRAFALPHPDYLITDVGTTIYRWQSSADGGMPRWRPEPGWGERLRANWQGRTARDIEPLLAGIQGLRLQEPEKQGRFKLSFYLDPERLDSLGETVRNELSRRGIPAEVVTSIDEAGDVGLLDVLPPKADKLNALAFLLDLESIPLTRALYAGDSGNDLAVLASPIPAVLVANAQEQVRAQAVRLARAAGTLETLYLARGDFLGMNGNYAAGILEGCVHFFPETKAWIEG